jgi:hypothetical protein
MYSSYSFTTSDLDRGEWSKSRPGRALLSGKGTAFPIGQEAGWAPEPVWTQRLEEKSSCLYRGSNLDRPVVQTFLEITFVLTSGSQPTCMYNPDKDVWSVVTRSDKLTIKETVSRAQATLESSVLVQYRAQ